MSNEAQKCFIWGTDARVKRIPNSYTLEVDSPRAGGEYQVTQQVCEDFLWDKNYTPHDGYRYEELNVESRVKLTDWLIDQRLLGETQPVINSEALAKLKERKLRKFQDRVRCFFLFLEKENFLLSNEIDQMPGEFYPKLTAWTSSGESGYPAFIEIIKNGGYLTPKGALSLKGIEKLEEITTTNFNSNQVFVAMWFPDEKDTHNHQQMKDFRDNVLKPAIKECGLEPIIIDEVHHADHIVDRIIAEIRRSKFIIADLTCGRVAPDSEKWAPRGGVYYEAGFAHGLGLPVIITCRDDCFSQVHFDLAQVNRLKWNPDKLDEIKQQLIERIAGMELNKEGHPKSLAATENHS